MAATKRVVSYNKQKIAMLYGISEKQLNSWMQDEDFQKDFGEYRGKAFTPKQIEIMVDHFGPFAGYEE